MVFTKMCETSLNESQYNELKKTDGYFNPDAVVRPEINAMKTVEWSSCVGTALLLMGLSCS